MNRTLKISVALFALGALVSCLVWLTSGSPAQAGPPPPPPAQSGDIRPFGDVNQKARAARGGDERAVRELADEALNIFAPPEVPVFTRETMKERLVRAEVNYHKGARRGLSEADVARMVNELAADFGAPAYAKTNVHQVRVFRVSLMSHLPDFIDQPDPRAGRGAKRKVGASISRMAPLEAASIAMLMFQQKMFNQEYQLTPREFAVRRRQLNLEAWQARHGEQAERGPGRDMKPHLVENEPNPKKEEMEQAVNRRVAEMRPEELTGMADRALDRLGIER